MERGALRWVLLDLLQEGPKHGYEIIRCFEERTAGQYAPSPGALYPTLQLLNDLGQVTSEQDADRRVYKVTETGLAELAAHADRVASFWSRFTTEAPLPVNQHEMSFLQDALDDLTRTVWTRLGETVAREDVQTIRAVREAVERCQNEIRGIIAADPRSAILPPEPPTPETTSELPTG
jgi:DNA-binding PadR family transcriptional regulator